jgi:glycosyltransferase involved in cell wall biosynthesis
MSAWAILHLDLAEGPRDIPASDRPHLAVFWWRGLPLGCKALSVAELPFRRSQVAALAADLVAKQAAARSPVLGAPVRAGVDAAPVSRMTLADAREAAGVLSILDEVAGQPAPSAEALTVIVCTRDRPAMLEDCLASLAGQSSPPGQIVVVDNSGDHSAEAVAARRPGVVYVQEPRPGLSRARNAGVAVARGEFVAFTDDDVELPDSWTAEIVRAFADPEVDAVTGLVLPARLDTEAQRAFELDLGGFTPRYQPLRFDGSFIEATRAMGPQVWRIGAGANMAFRRGVFSLLGGFDVRLGAGASGCSEDSEYWYRILAAGGVCLYEPRAHVFHHHRRDWRGLRRQFRAYTQGHLSALVAQADRYGPSGDIARIFKQLPVHFLKTGLGAIKMLSWWRLRLLGEEMIGWLLGLQYLVRPRWRAGERLAQAVGPPDPRPLVRHA